MPLINNYFQLNEFFPNCSIADKRYVSENTQLSANLFNLWFELNRIRQSYGFPLIISSGFRNSERNKLVHGSPTSQHLTMSAVDVKVYTRNFINWLIDNSMFHQRTLGQVIFYPSEGFVHLSLCSSKFPELKTFYCLNRGTYIYFDISKRQGLKDRLKNLWMQ